MTQTSDIYAPLEACAADFNDLQKALTGPTGGARLAAIREALEATAINLGRAHGATELHRDDLAKLCRGLFAAGRIIGQLADTRGAA
ncbi:MULTISPECIES: hypothetical protein [Cupriavidus]|uniref:Type III secretion protein n=1 Tax=Cupriavidus taiwanensis TaxID=164546 RepID=A0A375JET1_9BURK|nr:MULTISPECIES: hypothetical protein [Cupriavidus]SPS02513.1 conserved hypothetical protein [Cupriavidus taiwanensis]